MSVNKKQSNVKNPIDMNRKVIGRATRKYLWEDADEVRFLQKIAGTMPKSELEQAFKDAGYSRSLISIESKAHKHGFKLGYKPK